LRTEDQTVGIYSDIDHTDPRFKFRFARLDVATGRFLYAAYGGARTSDLYDPKGCFGIGEATARHSPWGSLSFLAFNFDLTKYVAVVKTSAEPPDIVHFTCTNGVSGNFSANWVDLMTGGTGPRSMFGWETELKGNDSKGSFITLSWAWDFEAVLP
jgi:hypothetical protein